MQKKTAQLEIFKMLNFPANNVRSSELLDISRAGEDNAMLLAASVIIQGELTVAELTQFLSALSLDLEQDGILSNPVLLNTLKDNALKISFPQIRDGLTNRYSEWDYSVKIPVFEDYVRAFYSTYLSLIPPQITDGQLKEFYASEAVFGNLNFSNASESAVYETGLIISNDPSVTLSNYTDKYIFALDNYSSDLVIFGLSPNTKYYARFFVTSRDGTSYGTKFEFTTMTSNLNPQLSYGSVEDNEGNRYATIVIGTQTWMAENLRVSHYNNGDSIEYVRDSKFWSPVSGAFTQYDNEPTYKNVLGNLYNGYVVADNRGICPSGWHVPSKAEWMILGDIANGKLRSGYWNPSQPTGTNESGFSGLSVGIRSCGIQQADFGCNGVFYGQGLLSYWWSTETICCDAIGNLAYWSISLDGQTLGASPNSMDWGFSVRCFDYTPLFPIRKPLCRGTVMRTSSKRCSSTPCRMKTHRRAANGVTPCPTRQLKQLAKRLPKVP